MDQPTPLNAIARQVLNHSLYEYSKGVRGLFLMTTERAALPALMARINHYQVASFIQPVTKSKINLYFGKSLLVEVCRQMITKPLSSLSAEEDFILGTLLGYDREQQCARYLQRLAPEANTHQESAATISATTGSQSR